jgi:hypothetical protein
MDLAPIRCIIDGYNHAANLLLSISRRSLNLGLTFTDVASLQPDNEWRNAVHEAGHAVFAVKSEIIYFTDVDVGSNEYWG